MGRVRWPPRRARLAPRHEHEPRCKGQGHQHAAPRQPEVRQGRNGQTRRSDSARRRYPGSKTSCEPARRKQAADAPIQSVAQRRLVHDPDSARHSTAVRKVMLCHRPVRRSDFPSATDRHRGRRSARHCWYQFRTEIDTRHHRPSPPAGAAPETSDPGGSSALRASLDQPAGLQISRQRRPKHGRLEFGRMTWWRASFTETLDQFYRQHIDWPERDHVTCFADKGTWVSKRGVALARGFRVATLEVPPEVG